MKKTTSIVAVIMIILATAFGFTACKNCCKNGNEKCQKASCCNGEKCCDKCSDKCTIDNKCCDKCKVGEEKQCCKKDSTACTKDEKKPACCMKDSIKK